MDIMDPVVNDYDEYYNKIIYFLKNPDKKKKIELQIKQRSQLLLMIMIVLLNGKIC